MNPDLTSQPHVPPHSKKRRGKKFWVLLSVALVVVVLLGLVLAFVGSGIAKWGAMNARVEKCRVQVQLLENRLHEYESDNGEFPPGDGSERSSNSLYRALYEDGLKSGGKIHMPELEGKRSGSHAFQIEKGLLMDPFEQGRPFFYLRAVDENGAIRPAAKNPDFDLWSVGPDGRGRGDKGMAPSHLFDDVTNY